MSAIKRSATELIGNTPLLAIPNYARDAGVEGADILAKLEYFNVTGSVKDRIALAMIEDAERSGRLQPGSHIVEPTSGNTGIGLAAVATAKGYRVTIVLPASLSVERRALIRSYGAELLLTPASKAIRGAIAYVNEWKAKDPSIVVLDQFNNPANPAVHYATTGPEIWRDTQGHVDVFVAGIGTGGTISGAGRYLKEQNPNIRIIGLEPAKSPVLNGGQPGPHGLQGIGTGFVPGTLDTTIYDEVLDITEEDSIAEARRLGLTEGVFVGISCGTALRGALEIARRPQYAGKRIVTLLPDSGDRYLSTKLGQFDAAPEVDVEG